MTGQARSWLPATTPFIDPVWSTTMPATTRTLRSRPHSTPAYELARPASVWITALRRRPPAGPGRPAGSGQTFPPGREHPVNLPFLVLDTAVPRMRRARRIIDAMRPTDRPLSASGQVPS